jgi:hypothetical protein
VDIIVAIGFGDLTVTIRVIRKTVAAYIKKNGTFSRDC